MRTQNSYTAVQLHSIQAYAKMGLKPKVIKHRLETDYSPTKFPSRTIKFYMKKAMICDDVAIRKAGSGRKRRARTEANVEQVLKMVKTGDRSIRRIARDIDVKISQTSILRIVKDAGLESPKKESKLDSNTDKAKSKRKPSGPKKSKCSDSSPDTARLGSTDAQSTSQLDLPLVSTGVDPSPAQPRPLPAALFEPGFGVSAVYQPNVCHQFPPIVSGSATNTDDTDPGLTSTRHATNAQIYCDQASRALQFSDYSSAVVNLKLALNELGSVGFH